MKIVGHRAQWISSVKGDYVKIADQHAPRVTSSKRVGGKVTSEMSQTTHFARQVTRLVKKRPS